LEDHSIINIQSLRIELPAEVQVILAQNHSRRCFRMFG